MDLIKNYLLNKKKTLINLTGFSLFCLVLQFSTIKGQKEEFIIKNHNLKIYK